MAANAFKAEETLRRFWSMFSSHFSEQCDISNVLASFVAENVIGSDKVKEIISQSSSSEKVQMLLQHISARLEAGDTIPFYIMLKIVEQHDGMELAKQIWRTLDDEGKRLCYKHS